MNTTTRDRHLTDTELLRVMDGDESDGIQPTDSERARAALAGHLDECSHCADALEELERDSRLIHQYFEAADFEDRGRSHTRDTERWRGTTAEAPIRTGQTRAVRAAARRRSWSWLKAAAVLVLVAGPLAAFPGVRSWVVERVAGPAEESDAVVPTSATPTVLRFTHDPGGFLVRFTAGAAGTITLERSPGAEAELRATGGDPETVVAASSLEIRNTGEGRYRLRLPGTITGAWVVVGERAVAVSAAQIDRRTVITLDRAQSPR